MILPSFTSLRSLSGQWLSEKPDEGGAVVLALLGVRISIEVRDGHDVGVQSPQRNVFLFQWTVCCLFTCVSAHGSYLLLMITHG